jgi:Heparinase II/III-like protein/Heparinase II/III N-terminus
MRRPKSMRVVTALITCLVCCTASVVEGQGAAAQPLGSFPCAGFSQLDRSNAAAAVMHDIISVPGFPSYRVGVKGNIRWTLDPFHHPSWRLQLHSLRWEGALLTEFRRTHNAVYLNRAAVITRDWIRDNPMAHLVPIAIEAQAHRTQVLLCLHELIGNQPWLVAALNAHAVLIERHFSGFSNHGLDESIALLGIGCRLGRRAYANLASARIARVVPALVDANGVNTEQSTGYQQYDHARLVVARTRLIACGYRPPGTLAVRLARMPMFIAHSTMPDGTTPQLGDTEAVRVGNIPGTAAEYGATLGTSGRPPTSALVAIYPAGYVFGRSTWRPFTSASYFSVRFGPPRIRHGHRDHTSITWFARGRLLLTETGHIGYEASARRVHALSPEGHNVLTVAGRDGGNPATRLLRSSVRPGSSFFELADSANGVARRRSILVLTHPDVVVVLDSASAGTPVRFRQLWHLPADMSVWVTGRGGAVALPARGDVRLQLAQVPLPGQQLPRGATTVIRGQRSPVLMGWLAPKVLHWLAAPVVSMNRAGSSTRILTVIAAGPRTGRVLVSGARLGVDGWWHVRLSVAGVSTGVRISGGGTLARG